MQPALFTLPQKLHHYLSLSTVASRQVKTPSFHCHYSPQFLFLILDCCFLKSNVSSSYWCTKQIKIVANPCKSTSLCTTKFVKLPLLTCSESCTTSHHCPPPLSANQNFYMSTVSIRRHFPSWYRTDAHYKPLSVHHNYSCIKISPVTYPCNT